MKKGQILFLASALLLGACATRAPQETQGGSGSGSAASAKPVKVSPAAMQKGGRTHNQELGR